MITLHGYWRSTATYRVRIALALKGLDYRQVAHDLRTGAQREAGFVALSPQGLVPALETGGAVLTQSLAIIEWLDEAFPTPPLLPADPICRATVRAMAQIVACDIHPLNNLRVLTALREDLGAGEAAVSRWIARWIQEGFAALETLVARHGGRFAYGDTPSLADCCLVPQLFAAERFEVDVEEFPRLVAAADEAAVSRWIARWIQEGFAALETLVARHGGRFAYGDTPSLADCCLVPQLFAAERFEVDVAEFPRLLAAAENARKLDAVGQAAPALQPDAD